MHQRMTMPPGMIASRTSDTICEALVRDHGVGVQVMRAFLDPDVGLYCEFRIGDAVWRYDAAGNLVDSYRMHARPRKRRNRGESEDRVPRRDA